MEVYRGSKVKKKGTRCYDLEKVLDLGRTLFSKDRLVTKIILINDKKNNKVTLLKNHRRTKFPDIKILI